MPYLFWIDHVNARIKLVELVFSPVSWTKIYSLQNFQDLIFRHQDLAPWAIVYDEQQFPNLDEEVMNFIIKNKIKIIHIAEPEEVIKFAALSIGKISRVLKPMSLVKDIEVIFKQTVDNDTFH